jgi:DinB superfamily
MSSFGVERDMTTTVSDELRYPIGRFKAAMPFTQELRDAAIDALAGLPARMREAVAGLDDRQLDTAYRPGGWTVRQVVHHVPDSHVNAFVRLKLALTEDTPTIKPYDENAWSTLADARLPIAVSLDLLEAIHTRWVAVYHAMAAEQFARSFVHPELGAEITLDHQLQNYAWHSHHHLAHITELRRREGW